MKRLVNPFKGEATIVCRETFVSNSLYSLQPVVGGASAALVLKDQGFLTGPLQASSFLVR